MLRQQSRAADLFRKRPASVAGRARHGAAGVGVGLRGRRPLLLGRHRRIAGEGCGGLQLPQGQGGRLGGAGGREARAPFLADGRAPGLPRPIAQRGGVPALHVLAEPGARLDVALIHEAVLVGSSTEVLLDRGHAH